jgi:hypothetical protein
MSIESDALESASAECTSACDIRAGSTGSGAVVVSVACATAADCSGVRNEFGVAYSECCTIPGYAVGVCVSETHAFSTFEPAGGTCL